MNKPTLTYEDILAMKKLAESSFIKPAVVKTKAQAAKMTRENHGGRKWKKGDEYYSLISTKEDPLYIWANKLETLL